MFKCDPYEDDPGPLIVGMDTTQIPVRLFVGAILYRDGATDISPRDWETFDTLRDLRTYWHQHPSLRDAQIVLSTETADPMAVRAWLEKRGYEITHVDDGSPWPKGDVLNGIIECIGPEFEQACLLANCAFYRSNIPLILGEICTKLFETELSIKTLRGEAARLLAVLTPRSSEAEIPF